MPLPLGIHRLLWPLAALASILAVSTSSVGAAAHGPARADEGYARLLVATDRADQTRAVARRIESLGSLSVRVLRGPSLLAVRVPRRDAPALRRRLEQIRGVRFVERNHVVMRIASTNAAEAVPTDPLWPHQWGPARIDAPKAWAVTMGSPRVVIAVLDTGVDLEQPDLEGALVPGYDIVNGDNDPSDDNGHGTRTAGIVGARADNGLGISGVCPRCSVMPVKVVAANGTATGLDVASGITWATDHRAAVISMSFGGTQDNAVAAAVRYAESKGVLVVAAAGNGGSTQPFYPAADPGVLSVAATQTNDHRYPWSNYGSWVAVAAPGCDTTTFMGGGFGGFCGTSASAPVVAGLAGLALSYAPNSSANRIEHAIVSGARPVAGIAGGRVDAVRTLTALGATLRRASAARASSKSKSHPLVNLVRRSRSGAKTRRVAAKTRVRHRILRGQWHFPVTLAAGRVAATLRSPKAGSCSLSLASAHAIWLSSRRGHKADSLVARVPAGKYRVDVSCRARRARLASLAVRARFPKVRHGSHARPRRIWGRGLPVRVANFLDRS